MTDRRAAVIRGLRDLMTLSGAGLISYGAWLVYEPAGFIVGGTLALAAGVIGSLRAGG